MRVGVDFGEWSSTMPDLERAANQVNFFHWILLSF